MGYYKKRPVRVEAYPLTADNCQWAATWCGGELVEGTVAINIHTKEGIMQAVPGDYIIKGVQGEFYPCKRDIFMATYTPDNY